MNDALEEAVPRVYRFALRLTNDRHLAEDLTQETILRAWRRRRELRDAQAMHTWLFQIAANIWRDEQRRKRLQNSSRRKLQHGGDSRISVPEATASANEVRARALDGMNRLPQRQREVLYLSAVEKLSLEEIARTLEISKTAAKGSLCLARKKMRQWLKDFVPDTGKGE